MERADIWRESQRTGRLPLKTKIIYALGEMPGSHMNSAIGTLLALYYNQILGVSASIIAIAMGLAFFSTPFLTLLWERTQIISKLTLGADTPSCTLPRCLLAFLWPCSFHLLLDLVTRLSSLGLQLF